MIFGLSLACYDVVLIFHHLVTVLYLRQGDSDMQSGFNQSKISYYGHQYIEELES